MCSIVCICYWGKFPTCAAGGRKIRPPPGTRARGCIWLRTGPCGCRRQVAHGSSHGRRKIVDMGKSAWRPGLPSRPQHASAREFAASELRARHRSGVRQRPHCRSHRVGRAVHVGPQQQRSVGQQQDRDACCSHAAPVPRLCRPPNLAGGTRRQPHSSDHEPGDTLYVGHGRARPTWVPVLRGHTGTKGGRQREAAGDSSIRCMRQHAHSGDNDARSRLDVRLRGHGATGKK